MCWGFAGGELVMKIVVGRKGRGGGGIDGEG